MPAAGLAGCDALILLVPRFAPASVPADGRLAVVARFGVGYDSVDVPACTEAGIALVHHARRRAPAGGGLDPHLHPGADPEAADQGPPLPPGAGRLGQALGPHGRGPGRQDPGPARHGQYRRRGVPPRRAVRHALHRPRPLPGPEGRGRARRRAGRARGAVPPCGLPLGQRAAERGHAPHRRRAAARR